MEKRGSPPGMNILVFLILVLVSSQTHCHIEKDPQDKMCGGNGGQLLEYIV